MLKKHSLIIFIFVFANHLSAEYLGIGNANVKNMIDQVKQLTDLKNNKASAENLEKEIEKAKDAITRLNNEASGDPSPEINQAALTLESSAIALINSMKKIRAAGSNEELKAELEALKKIRTDTANGIDPVDKGYLATEKLQARDYLLAVKEVLDRFVKEAMASAWDRMTAAGFPSNISSTSTGATKQAQ